MKKKRRRHSRSGFTIVEILVVVVIIAFLAGMVALPLFRHLGTAKQSVAKAKLVEIEKAIEIFMITYGRLPQDLEELVSRPADIPEEKWEGPSLKAKDLIDPWERQFIYEQPGDHWQYDLYSLGKDGQEGGEDEDADVFNW